MIDVQSEKLVPLADVPALLPPSRNGRRPHISVIYRWVQKGLHGIRLEALQLGGRRVTSREALSRFFQALSANAGLSNPDPPKVRTPGRRQREHGKASAACEASGW